MPEKKALLFFPDVSDTNLHMACAPKIMTTGVAG
jgi:hypothetical protein